MTKNSTEYFILVFYFTNLFIHTPFYDTSAGLNTGKNAGAFLKKMLNVHSYHTVLLL